MVRWHEKCFQELCNKLNFVYVMWMFYYIKFFVKNLIFWIVILKFKVSLCINFEKKLHAGKNCTLTWIASQNLGDSILLYIIIFFLLEIFYNYIPIYFTLFSNQNFNEKKEKKTVTVGSCYSYSSYLTRNSLVCDIILWQIFDSYKIYKFTLRHYQLTLS